jgi:hypothetical protein
MTGQVVPSDVTAPERLQSGDRLDHDLEFGVMSDDLGDLYFLRKQPHTPISQEPRVYDETVARFMALEGMRIQVNGLAKRQSHFANILGFSHTVKEGENGETTDVTTVPTAEHLNGALTRIYDTAQEEYPMTFVANHSRFAHITGREFITRLADSELVLSSSKDLNMFSHDTLSHAIGYCRMTAPLLLAIRARAQQLRDENKLTSIAEQHSASGSDELADEEARQFAGAVDHLSDFLTRDGRRQNWEREHIRKHLSTILHIQGPAILRGAKMQLMYLSLARHHKWLEQRAGELKSPA